MIEHAKDFEPATCEIISALVERGTHDEIMSVNAATRYWAACEAVFVSHHPTSLTRERFNLVPFTILINPRRRNHFLGYLPNDWQIIQRRFYAANAEVCRSNWAIEFEDDD